MYYKLDKKYASEEIVACLENLGTVEGSVLLYDVQTWLRDVHNIHITIGNSASGYWWELSKADNGTTIYDYNYSGPNDGGKWDCYEDALDSAILTVLNSKLIKKTKQK